MQRKPKLKKSATKLPKKRLSIKSKVQVLIEQGLSPRSQKNSFPVTLLTTSERTKKKARTGMPHKRESSFDEEDSINSANFQKETEKVKAQVLSSLQLFKSASHEFLAQNELLEYEIDNFQAEFEHVKTEVSEIMAETTKSKENLLEFKKRI